MKHPVKALLAALCTCSLLLSFGCANSAPTDSEKSLPTIKVGASPAPHAEILEACRAVLKEKGYELEVVPFTDYIMPNVALDSGELDANFFQHTPYLEEFCASRKTKLEAAAKIHFEPLGLYGGKSSDLENLPDGAEIAVPNDPTNEARALQLLESTGIIKLRDGAGLSATVQDIAENPHNVKILEAEAAQLPRTLPDVDFAVINGNYAIDADIIDKLLLTEDPESEAAQTFANVLAVQEGKSDTPETKALVEALTSDTVREFIEKTYRNTVVPVF